MTLRSALTRAGLASPWSQELAFAALALLAGVAVMPALIFYGGLTLLGRYDGASLEQLYDSLLVGMRAGSLASWTVLLGPYALYLLFKGLRVWWRAGNAAA